MIAEKGEEIEERGRGVERRGESESDILLAPQVQVKCNFETSRPRQSAETRLETGLWTCFVHYGGLRPAGGVVRPMFRQAGAGGMFQTPTCSRSPTLEGITPALSLSPTLSHLSPFSSLNSTMAPKKAEKKPAEKKPAEKKPSES